MLLNRSFFKDDVDKMTTSTGDASRELHQPSASTVRNDSKWTDWSNSWDWRESSWQDVWWWWKLKDFNELWKNSMGKRQMSLDLRKNKCIWIFWKLWVLWDEKCWFCFWYIFISFYITYFFRVLEKTTTFRTPEKHGMVWSGTRGFGKALAWRLGLAVGRHWTKGRMGPGWVSKTMAGKIHTPENSHFLD